MANNNISVQIVPTANDSSTFLPSNRSSYQGRSYSIPTECCKEDTCSKVTAFGLCLTLVGSIAGIWAGGNAYAACTENCESLEVITIISGIVIGALCCVAICKGSDSSSGPCGHVS